ncbi:hypothetical protein ACFL1O_00745 [Patescibacteria group bacterium]
MKSFSLKEKDSVVAVFDIGSSSIGGLLFKQGEKLPQILCSIRKEINFLNEKNSSKLRRDLCKTITSVADYLKTKSSEKSDYALCVFSSPWYISQTKIIKVQRDMPFEINQNLIKKLIKDETDIFHAQWNGTKNKAQNKNMAFLEQIPVKTILNGYDTKSPLNKKTKKFELYALLSLTVGSIHEKIKKEISDHLNISSVYSHSFPFVALEVLNNILNIKDGLVFVDISGGITDIFIVRNNIIEEMASFPKGENFFINKLAEAFNSTKEEARGTFSQYQRNELNSKYSEKTRKVLDDAGKEWGEYLKKLLIEVVEDKYLPQNLYFCGSIASSKEIHNKVLTRDFSKFTIFSQPFNVHFLLPESLKYHFDFKQGFSDNKDIFLLISALFANQLLTKPLIK